MKKIIFIIFLMVLILGCNKKVEISLPKRHAVINKYPTEAPDEWKIICTKAPYINSEKIPEDVLYAVNKVYNHFAKFPNAEEANIVCENEYKAFLECQEN